VDTGRPEVDQVCVLVMWLTPRYFPDVIILYLSPQNVKSLMEAPTNGLNSFYFSYSRIQLIKSTRNVKDQCWLSLLEGQFMPGNFFIFFNLLFALKFVRPF
jgi:hypothetical protein